MKTKFKVGDRVNIIKGPHEGQQGTVIDIGEFSTAPGIRLDKYGRGNHDCRGKCPRGYGWYEESSWLESGYPKGSLDYILFSPLEEK